VRSTTQRTRPSAEPCSVRLLAIFEATTQRRRSLRYLSLHFRFEYEQLTQLQKELNSESE
jgi:hypothetical protein